MANIWKLNRDVNNQTKRNNFDLSFQNHLTMQMGTLYPVFCKEVVPGDSFRIETAFGLKFMPLVFPVQTKMRAHMHFFYVRNKNLWNRWEDWIQGLKTADDGVVHPYISQNSDFFKTGSLADYLGVPTTLASAGSVDFAMHSYNSVVYGTNDKSELLASAYNSSSIGSSNTTGLPAASWYWLLSNVVNDYLNFDQMQSLWMNSAFAFAFYGWNNYPITGPRLNVPVLGDPSSVPTQANECYILILTRPSGDTNSSNWSLRAHYTADFITVENGFANIGLFDSFVSEWNSFIGQGLECCLAIGFGRDVVAVDRTRFRFALGESIQFTTSSVSVSDTDVPCPFDQTSSPEQIHISALPFRAYESIYYSYFANSVLQPMRINGEVEYNRYNTTLEGGADSTPYHLFRRNYELDFLTSAVPSPQQGNAPLVGLTALGTITVTDPETGEVTTAKAQIDHDDKIVGLQVTSPIANRDHAIALNQLASAGLSINDLRSTGALQRWLETNIRKGYRYLDFIAGHFGVKPEYRELDMPEYIGGFSRDVNVSQIVSSADTAGFMEEKGASLGSFGGMASCFGGSEHSVTHYCDDYGFIMGILCVTPTPSYSQLLPKHFLKYNPLDYYFEEMSQLGLQPITYEEVCPIQAYYQARVLEDGTHVRDTFGYQRPNYDLVASVDEIHGQFRQSLNSFLINRVFQSRPELGDDFLRIDPNETNQIFVDQAPASDNLLGQIVFKVDAKRPLPVVHIPSLRC